MPLLGIKPDNEYGTRTVKPYCRPRSTALSAFRPSARNTTGDFLDTIIVVDSSRKTSSIRFWYALYALFFLRNLDC